MQLWELLVRVPILSGGDHLLPDSSPGMGVVTKSIAGHLDFGQRNLVPGTRLGD